MDGVPRPTPGGVTLDASPHACLEPRPWPSLHLRRRTPSLSAEVAHSSPWRAHLRRQQRPGREGDRPLHLLKGEVTMRTLFDRPTACGTAGRQIRPLRNFSGVPAGTIGHVIHADRRDGDTGSPSSGTFLGARGRRWWTGSPKTSTRHSSESCDPPALDDKAAAPVRSRGATLTRYSRGSWMTASSVSPSDHAPCCRSCTHAPTQGTDSAPPPHGLHRHVAPVASRDLCDLASLPGRRAWHHQHALPRRLVTRGGDRHSRWGGRPVPSGRVRLR